MAKRSTKPAKKSSKPSKPARKPAKAAARSGKPSNGAAPKAARPPRERKPKPPLSQRDAKRAAAEEEARRFAIESARLFADDKCTDIVVLDVRRKSQISDFIVIASGTSDRQMRSAAEHMKDLAREQGHEVFRTNLDEQTTWIVLDCVDVVAHIFEPNQRAFYDLEMLWGDAPRLKWERPGKPAAAAAE